MNTDTIAKQAIQFQKNLFENTFHSIVMVQDQIERAANIALDGAFWLPEEGVNTLREVGQTVKQGRDEWKRCVDENVQAIEKLFASKDESGAE